jgi:aspartate carbamoyltransferase catalytic subunit
LVLEGRDVVSVRNLTREDVESVFRAADKMRTIPAQRTKTPLLQDKILATLFFQPSTRTRLSFESAMQRLGGSVLGFASPEVTRAGDFYGETLKDTGRMIEIYADVVTIRHPQADAPSILAETIGVPVISAGAGMTSTWRTGPVGEHPTQTLLDLYTIKKEKGEVDGVKILLMGNMGTRAVHSLGIGLAKFNDVDVYVLTSDSLGLPDVVKSDFEDARLRYRMISSIKEAVKELDVIYVVPIRLALGVEKTPDAFVLDASKLKGAKPDLIVLHPLPRLDEIPTEVDNTPYAKYYVQAYNGLVVRMALLGLVLGREL